MLIFPPLIFNLFIASHVEFGAVCVCSEFVAAVEQTWNLFFNSWCLIFSAIFCCKLVP